MQEAIATLTLQDFVNKVRSDGKIFSITFIKRSNGQTRSMICRTGVTKNTKGGHLNYDPKNYGLLQVYDMKLKSHKCIPVEAILSLSMNKIKYIKKDLKLIPQIF